MKKTRDLKGELLVETLIAMLVFSIMTVCSFKAYQSFAKLNKKDADYLFFESVCLSIDSYYDNLGKDFWAQEYFGEHYHYSILSNDFIELFKEQYDYLPQHFYGIQMYNSNYELISSSSPNYEYVLTFLYDENDNLIINIENTNNGYNIIEDLNYGKSQASSTNDIAYYEDLMNNNVGIKQLKPKPEEEPDIGENGVTNYADLGEN